MYCPKCGTKTADDTAQFCSNCGANLRSEQLVIPSNEETGDKSLTSDSSENILVERNLDQIYKAEQVRSEKHKPGKSSLFWPISVPVIILIITIGVVFAYYNQQIHTNQEVVSLKGKAEKAALKGEYKDSLSLLKKAEGLRPSYKVLAEDKVRIEAAIALDKSLTAISDSLKTQQIDKAESEITSFNHSLQKLEGPLFTPFHKKIEEKATTLAVAKIKQEINNLSTVEELASKLTALTSLQAAETDAVKQIILSKIVDVTTKDAETELSDKQFSDALSTVDKGLEYAEKDAKLLSFKDRIQNEQAAFEKAEQQRIEQAMEAAAQEDLTNRTAAVNVTDLQATTDEYGDVQITGEIKNTATVPVSSITLYYTVSDLNGNEIGSDYGYVSPFYLEPGDSGNFESTYYGAYQDVNVKITRATWQLN